MKFVSNGKSKAVNVAAAFNPILVVSKLAAVCTIVRDTEKDEFVTPRFFIVVQVTVSIVIILHLMFIPYAVIYVEMVSIIFLNRRDCLFGLFAVEKYLRLVK